jgi:multicomponent K+:H+ antiporter subunit G
MIDYFIASLLVLGGIFGLIGSIGMVKLRAPMQRLHAPTKVSTLGLGAVLLASALHSISATGTASWHEILILVFVFITAPLSALFMAKVHLDSGHTDANWDARK